jgi:hypothetical protein
LAKEKLNKPEKVIEIIISEEEEGEKTQGYIYDIKNNLDISNPLEINNNHIVSC